MYLTESSSPFVPGARPSNSSDARILICASNPSGVIASSAGCKRNANSSTARHDMAAAQRIAAKQSAIFIHQCRASLRLANAKIASETHALLEPHILIWVMIKNRRIPAFHAWANQKSMGIEVDRQNRGVFEQNCLRLLKRGITRRLITGPAGLANKPIILGI